MAISTCCSAETDTDIMLCGQCKEHCDVIEAHCLKCDWEGMDDDLEVDGESTQEDGMVIRVMCPKCGSEDIEDNL